MSAGPLDLNSIGILFLNGLIALEESHPPGTYHNKLLGLAVYKLKQQGIRSPVYTSWEETAPLNKEQLLALAGHLQMHSTDHRHNNARRQEFKAIAAILRDYLYDNFQLSPNIIKKGRPSDKPPASPAKVKNVPNA